MARGERTTGNRLIGVALGGLGAIVVAVVLVLFCGSRSTTRTSR